MTVTIAELTHLAALSFPDIETQISVEVDRCLGDVIYRMKVVHDSDPFRVVLSAEGLRSGGATRDSVAADLREQIKKFAPKPANTQSVGTDSHALESACVVLDRYGYAPTARHLRQITNVIRARESGAAQEGTG